MAVFISTTPQVVANGGNVAFSSTAVKGGCNIQHRDGSGMITARGSGSCCNYARYRVSFHANVTGVAGAIQFALYQGGEQLPETLMSVVPAATTDVWSITSETEILVPCSCTSIGVRSVTASDVTVNTAEIVINRIA